MVFLYGEWVPSSLGLGAAMLVAFGGVIGIALYVYRHLPPADL